MEKKTSLSHHRRRVHTISIILSCLVDSAVIREDNYSLRSMGQTSDLYKYEPNHRNGTYEGDFVLFGNLVGGKYLSASRSHASLIDLL